MEKREQSTVKVRLEGTRDSIRKVARALRWAFWVLDQSREYPNRTNKGVYRCYVTLYPGQLRVDGMPKIDQPGEALGEG